MPEAAGSASRADGARAFNTTRAWPGDQPYRPYDAFGRKILEVRLDGTRTNMSIRSAAIGDAEVGYILRHQKRP
jgi:hypothetical protein